MTQATEDEGKLIPFYRNLLPAVGYYSDSDGMISHHLPACEEDTMPVMIGTKRLVLPTLTHRRNPDFERRMIFNPMLQNITGSESQVMDKFRDRATNYLGFIISFLFASLGTLAIRKESHQSLNPDEARYLTPLTDADAGFCERLRNIIASSDVDHRNNREFVKFTLHKGRIWNGEKRQRVAGAHFRLYEQILDPEFKRVIAGVSLRQKDVKMLKDLFEFVFPEITGTGYIEFGTDQSTAPSMVALMTVYKQVVDRVNTMAMDMSNCMTGSQLVMVPTNWWDGIVNVNDMIAEINALPMFEGNNSKNKVMSETEKARITQSAMVAAEQHAAKHVVAPAAPAVLGAPQTISLPQSSYVPAAQTTRPGAMLGSSGRNPSIGPATIPVAQLGSSSSTTPPPAQPLPVVTASNGLNVVPMASAAQALHLQQQEQQRQAAEQAHRAAYEAHMNPLGAGQQLPEGARMVAVNGANVLYVPAPTNASGVVPVGAMTLDGRLYVPYQQMVQQGMVAGHVPGTMVPGALPPGANMQQMMMTDAATWPNVSPQLATMLNGNPTMKMQYLSQLMASQQNVFAQQQQTQQQAVPRYLREVLEEDRQAEINQRNAQFGGAFGGMRLGQTMPGHVPGVVPPGYPAGYQQQAGYGYPPGYPAVPPGYPGYVPPGYPQAGYMPPQQGPHGYVQVGGYPQNGYQVPPGGGMRPPGT